MTQIYKDKENSRKRNENNIFWNMQSICMSCDLFRRGKEPKTLVPGEGRYKEASWLTNRSPERFYAWRHKTE